MSSVNKLQKLSASIVAESFLAKYFPLEMKSCACHTMSVINTLVWLGYQNQFCFHFPLLGRQFTTIDETAQPFSSFLGERLEEIATLFCLEGQKLVNVGPVPSMWNNATPIPPYKKGTFISRKRTWFLTKDGFTSCLKPARGRVSPTYLR